MWIGGVELPQELIDAHRAGDLVIFVGAGASIASPADLPDFWDLAQAIADDAGVAISPGEQPDVILGNADADELIDVHRRIATRIGDPDSKPNSLHRAIIRLARATRPTRIVTTNYDRHLSTILGDGLPEHRAPILPLGEDFDGLVYLHGTLEQEPRHLVATDQDFGTAYLLDGWAVRFLVPMFRRHTVLFVGYSHNDPVMTYLGRALPPTSRRFAIAEDTPQQRRHWRRLGITAVSYPNPTGDHSALPSVLDKWAERAEMRLLDHQHMIARLVAAPPSGIPEEMSYLQDVLRSDDKVRFFVEHARGLQWLAWIKEQPQFRQLFDGSGATSPLAEWFAEHFVAEEEFTQAAFEAVEACGGRLGFRIWSAIGHRLHLIGRPRPAWLARWVVLLLRDDPGYGHEWLEYALNASRLPEDRDTLLLLFTHLTAPTVDFRYPRRPALPSSFELKIRGDVHWLRRAWDDVIRPAIADNARELLAIIDLHLRQAYRLSDAISRSSRWDFLSRSRLAIERHPQNSFGTPVDILVDAARDCVEALLQTQARAAVSQLQGWAEAEPALLRRLAIHGWGRRTDITATQKLEWIRDHGWLTNHALWHETATLIAIAAGDASVAVLDAMVRDIENASTDDMTQYERYNALSWITRQAPELESARVALNRSQAEHPEFKEGKYLDFHRWSESGSRVPSPPISIVEFRAKVAEDPIAAVMFLRQFENIPWSAEETSWDDALSLVAATVSAEPEVGFALIGTLPAISCEVVKGWSRTSLDGPTAEAVVKRLNSSALADTAHYVAAMLGGFGMSSNEGTVWYLIRGTDELAEKTWAAIDGKPPSDAIDRNRDWLSMAINSPGGHLAEFWLHVIEAQWQSAADNWSGIPAHIKAQLENMIAGVDDRAAAVQVLLSSHLVFLHTADADWAESTILPLLDWSDPKVARRTWDGFLAGARWNDRLLNAGLRDFLLDASEQADQFGDSSRQTIHQLLANVAVYAAKDPSSSGWLAHLTRVSSTDLRVSWIRDVRSELDRVNPDVAENQWNLWMRAYWQGRLDSDPKGLTASEASAIALWSFALIDSAPDAVAMSMQRTAGFESDTDVLEQIAERADTMPASHVDLLVHLLRGTEPPFHEGFLLKKIVDQLRARRPAIKVEPILEEAVRLGFSEASGW